MVLEYSLSPPSSTVPPTKIKSSWEYRQYITNNANEIIKQNFLATVNNTGYKVPVIKEKIKIKSSIIKFDSLNDRSHYFETSDLKEIYLKKEQINARKVAPIIYKDKNKS